jgi:hypothetical protein
MISREEELRKIDEFIDRYGAKTGPTAFVCPSIQANSAQNREFVHSDVKKKYTWMRTRHRGKK